MPDNSSPSVPRNIFQEEDIERGLSPISLNLSPRVKEWAKTTFRKWLVKEGPATKVTKLPGGAPQWAKDSFENGNLYRIDWVEARSKFASIVEFLEYMADNIPGPLRMSVESAFAGSADWHRELSAKREAARKSLMAEDGIETILELPRGYKWVRVTGRESLVREGDRMGHCVNSYRNAVRKGRIAIYSLRDQHNEPHVTVSYRFKQRKGEEKIVEQIAGQANTLVLPKYHEAIIELFATLSPLEIDPSKSGLSSEEIIEALDAKGVLIKSDPPAEYWQELLFDPPLNLSFPLKAFVLTSPNPRSAPELFWKGKMITPRVLRDDDDDTGWPSERSHPIRFCLDREGLTSEGSYVGEGADFSVKKLEDALGVKLTAEDKLKIFQRGHDRLITLSHNPAAMGERDQEGRWATSLGTPLDDEDYVEIAAHCASFIPESRQIRQSDGSSFELWKVKRPGAASVFKSLCTLVCLNDTPLLATESLMLSGEEYILALQGFPSRGNGHSGWARSSAALGLFRNMIDEGYASACLGAAFRSEDLVTVGFNGWPIRSSLMMQQRLGLFSGLSEDRGADDPSNISYDKVPWELTKAMRYLGATEGYDDPRDFPITSLARKMDAHFGDKPFAVAPGTRPLCKLFAAFLMKDKAKAAEMLMGSVPMLDDLIYFMNCTDITRSSAYKYHLFRAKEKEKTSKLKGRPLMGEYIRRMEYMRKMLPHLVRLSPLEAERLAVAYCERERVAAAFRELWGQRV